jgi:hypothetical protein
LSAIGADGRILLSALIRNLERVGFRSGNGVLAYTATVVDINEGDRRIQD